MSATGVVKVTTGAVGSTVDTAASHLRFKRAADNTNDNLKPLLLPGTGVIKRSWIKWIKIYWTVLPAVSISNLRFLKDPASVVTLPTGFSLHGGVVSVYAEATVANETVDVVATDLMTTEITVNPAEVTTNLGVVGDPGTQDYMVIQIAVDGTTAVFTGNLPNVPLLYRWDEA